MERVVSCLLFDGYIKIPAEKVSGAAHFGNKKGGAIPPSLIVTVVYTYVIVNARK